MSANPFSFGNPIRDPARFCGRQAEIRQIVNRLRSSAHESTAVVGERRIGKTSLLYHLSDPQVAAELGLGRDQYCLVYVDFQGLTDITPQRFWQRVLKRMERVVSDEALLGILQAARREESLDLLHLEDFLEAINDAGLTVVLLMDEFEYVTQNPNFRPGFFGGLRALAIHNQLALVTATRLELVDLCHSEDIRSSPFFNIFASVVLRPFTLTEIDELLSRYSDGLEIPLSSDEKALIAEIGGGHPFFLQMAGYYLIERKTQGLDGEDLRTGLMADCDQQADPHFKYFWSHCSESEKISLLATLALSRQKPSKRSVPTLENLGRMHSRAHLDVPQLLRRGLIVEAEGRFRLLSPCLERWLGHEILSAPDEEESLASVEDWLAGGGRQDLEPVKGFLPRFKKQHWQVVGELLKEMSFEVVGAAAFELLMRGLT